MIGMIFSSSVHLKKENEYVSFLSGTMPKVDTKKKNLY
jgi:hypothetical protein